MRRTSLSYEIQTIATGTALGILLVLAGLLSGYLLASYISNGTSPIENDPIYKSVSFGLQEKPNLPYSEHRFSSVFQEMTGLKQMKNKEDII